MLVYLFETCFWCNKHVTGERNVIEERKYVSEEICQCGKNLSVRKETIHLPYNLVQEFILLRINDCFPLF